MQKKEVGPERRFITSPYMLLTLATLFWAGNTVVGKAANLLIPAFSLSFWRWVVALFLILPFGVRAVQRDWDFYCKNWKYLMMLAFFSVTAFNTFLYWALNWTTAINVSVIFATMPLVIFFLSWMVGGQKAKVNQIIGVLLALIGVLIVISKGNISILMNLNINYGDILVLVSVVCFGIYSILFKKLQADVDQIGLITVFIFFGLIGIAPFYAWDIYQHHFFSVDIKMVWILLYVGLFPSLLSFFFWNKAIESGGAHIAGMFFNLVPVFSSVLAVIFLKEIFTLSHLIGMVLIFIGIYFSTFYEHRPLEADIQRENRA
ncbi:protein of unknown function DUF6 transmembrane [Desulfofarcimen acetoxidans DSM 771]|uniref:EamA domain-containing protein n=1 Tax=Desulfofarcimen acetoxidans (strain ATCC 49208 / DSM 771 / KCTC 5769 / VKM B-1644 / 5575) TaxID=485916 RepID=C8W549_DESAS|nr:DMT family transporter [Desulfofarcimen acetoxidans]ACV61401.1 protein of unknown function DUF6 transmembrane [Desulfofarcimen acetoxidans DSM 771]